MPADRRSVSAARTPLTPEEVARRSFSSVFRGFDQTEVRDFLVRVSDDLLAAQDLEADLRRRLDDAETRAAAPPVITEEMVTAYLGEEAASILRSAHEAAHEIRSKAEESARVMREEAERDIRQQRASAEERLEARRAEIEAMAQGLREAAQAEADALLEQARDHGRRMVADAKELRAKVLNDLARRRKIAHAQVEQLRAGRTRLLEAYRLVRSSLDDVTVELEKAEVEARQAAEEAAHRVAEEPEITGDDFEAALGAAAEPGELAEPADDQPESGDAQVIDLEALSHNDQPIAAGVATEPVASVTETTAEPRRTGLRIVGRSRRKQSEDEQSASVLSTRTGSPGADSPRLGSPVSDLPLADEGITIIKEEPATAPGAAQAATEADDIVVIDELVTAEPRQVAPDETPSEPAGQAEETAAPAKADDTGKPGDGGRAAGLFARLKAERAKAVEVAEQTVNGTATVIAPTAEESVEADEMEAAVVEEAVSVLTDEVAVRAFEEREQVIEPLRKSMTRLLKRTLQDEQNDVLNRVRLQKGKINAGALPDGDEQRGRYQRAVEKTIRIAFDHGAAAVESMASIKEKDAKQAAQEVAEETAEMLVGPLLEGLLAGLEDVISAGGPDQERSAMDAVSAVYREWKSRRIEQIAGDALASAYARGAYTAIPEGSSVRWLISTEESLCAECTDNGRAEEMVRGKPFPSGATMPPAHSGCRCLIATA